MSAEEAIARAKLIAARLAGTGATASLTPGSSSPIAAPSGTAAGLPGGAVAPMGVAVGNGQVDAVAEAALAAAFGGSSSGASGGAASAAGGITKRKRWGTDTEYSTTPGVTSASDVSDAVAAALAAPTDQQAKRSKLGSSEVSKKVWIPVDKNPGYNYVGLLIGPGGSKQRELVEQAGGNVKISIRGRGSSSSNAVPGQPEEPLHVLLEGNSDSVSRAEQLVSELLNDSAKAQAEKDRQLALVRDATVDAASTTPGQASATAASTLTSTYQPKPVAHLLGLNSGGGHYGPGADATEAIEEKIGVPNGVVGFIIGRGGESITSMQRKSLCRVQIQKEHEMEPGTTQRIITLTGPNQESISMCRGIIEEMVQERLRMNQEQQNAGRSTFGVVPTGGPGANAAAQAAQLQQALSQGQAHIAVQVPNNDVGLIIGKGGATIRSIQDRSGANVQIPQGPDVDNPMIRSVNITHPNKEGAEFAKTLIEEILKGKMNHQQQQSNPYGGVGGHTASSTDVTVQVQIPDKDVGMCIGRGGCVIREMQQKTGTRIQIPSQPTPGQVYRIASVTGPAEGCQKVQEIIARISLEQSSQFVMTGDAFQNNANPSAYGAQYGQQQAYGQYGQQQQAYTQQQYGAAATGAIAGQQAQADYSAQWAAYYASTNQTAQSATAAQGTASTAVATQATSTGTDTGTSTQQGQQPAADSYYDAFFRYAYHYGEDAARKYYGAWSPPVGTANPYGTNPNAAATATAAAPSQEQNTQVASATNVASTSSAQVKDSSVRNVSNLPAWMTKS